MRKLLLPVMALAMLNCAAHSASVAATAGIVVPYSTCGWKYFVTTQGFDPLVGSSTAYDDSWWTDGCTPFVSSWGCGTPGTEITQEEHVLMRRHIFNHGLATIAHYTVVGLDVCSMYANGMELSRGDFPHDCTASQALTGQFLLKGGDNAILVFEGFLPPGGNLPAGQGGLLNVEIWLDDVTPTLPASWGRIKTIYR